jgi:hypothetical protein
LEIAWQEIDSELEKMAELRQALVALSQVLVALGYTSADPAAPAEIVTTATEVIGILAAYLNTEVQR